MHKFFSRGKNFIKQNESASFYEQTKNNQHIFIFSVLGRTSSTALQRILNSSNQICISGEPKGIVDGQLKLISKLEERQKKFVSSSNERLKASFKANKHNLPYPHALNIESTVFLG